MTWVIFMLHSMGVKGKHKGAAKYYSSLGNRFIFFYTANYMLTLNAMFKKAGNGCIWFFHYFTSPIPNKLGAAMEKRPEK